MCVRPVGKYVGAVLSNANRTVSYVVRTSTRALYPFMLEQLGKDAIPTEESVNMMLNAGEPDAMPVSAERTKGWSVDLTAVERNAAERDSKVWVSNDFMVVYQQDMAKFLPIICDQDKLTEYLKSIDVKCPLYDTLCSTDDMLQEREDCKKPENMKKPAIIAELKIRRVRDKEAIVWKTNIKNAQLNELLTRHRELGTGNELVAVAEAAAAAGAGAAGDMAVDEQAAAGWRGRGRGRRPIFVVWF
jgi:hypothetical protein